MRSLNIGDSSIVFFHFHCIPLIIIGIVSLAFAKKIADLMLRPLPGHKFNKQQPYKSLLYIWPIRFIGILCLGFSLLIFTSGPSRIFMNSDETRIDLLENGEIVQAKVQKAYFQHLASSGWKVIYEFRSINPKTDEVETFVGNAWVQDYEF